MADQRLVSYIKEQLAAGYEINSIKLNLARTGYGPGQIEPAAAAAYEQPKKQLAKGLLLVGGGAVVIAVLVTIIILSLSKTEEIQPAGVTKEKDVGLEVFLTKVVIKPGADLVFEVRLVNLGSGSNFEVAVKNEVFDQGSSVTKQEGFLTLGVQERKTYNLPLDLPEGSYQLKTTITYGTKEKVKTADFEISESETAKVEVAKFEILSGEIIQRIEDTKQVAETEPARAKELCLGSATDLEKDTCLLQVALKLNQADFCTDITNINKKDSCYVQIALALKNFNLCNNVMNQNLKKACSGFG